METLNRCLLCGSTELDRVVPENNIVRCRACDFVFDNPRPSLDELVAYYSQESKYDGWLEKESGRDRLWKRRLGLILKHRNSGSLLDVGTGIGQFLALARGWFNVVGTEVSESAVRIAREKYGLPVRRGTLEEVDFGEERFDVITITHVLEHVPYPDATVERCLSLLKEGGILVIAVPNEMHSVPRRLIKFVLGALGSKKFRKFGKLGLQKLVLDGTINEIHVSHFTDRTLRRWLQGKGLRILEDSLDPYFIPTGPMGLIHEAAYRFFLGIRKVFGKNLYDTLWIIAQRPPASAGKARAPG